MISKRFFELNIQYNDSFSYNFLVKIVTRLLNNQCFIKFTGEGIKI